MCVLCIYCVYTCALLMAALQQHLAKAYQINIAHNDEPFCFNLCKFTPPQKDSRRLKREREGTCVCVHISIPKGLCAPRLAQYENAGSSGCGFAVIKYQRVTSHRNITYSYYAKCTWRWCDKPPDHPLSPIPTATMQMMKSYV